MLSVSSMKDKTNIQPFSFTYLIDADGVKHHALNLVQAKEKYKNAISFQSQKTPSNRLNYHAAAYLTLSRKDGKVLNLPSKEIFISLINESQHVQISFLKQSSCYLKDKKQIKCAVIIELTDDIYKNKSNEEIKSLIIDAVKFNLDDHELRNDEFQISFSKPSLKHGDRKDKIKFLRFGGELKVASSAHLSSSNGKYHLALVGNAFLHPDYRTTSGINFAFLQAETLRTIFLGKNTLKQYSEASLEQAKQRSLDYVTRKFNELMHGSTLSGFLGINQSTMFSLKEQAAKSESQFETMRKQISDYKPETNSCSII